jgi:hypothetical protein
MTLPPRWEPLELTFQRLDLLLKRHFQAFLRLGRTKEQRWVPFHLHVTSGKRPFRPFRRLDGPDETLLVHFRRREGEKKPLECPSKTTEGEKKHH